MRHHAPYTAVLAVATALGALAAVASEGVVIEEQPRVIRGGGPIVSMIDGWTIRANNYTAQVDRQAVLHSLIVNQVEFMAPAVPIGRAWSLPPLFACQYQWHTKPYRPPVVTEVTADTIRAEGDRWTLQYTFKPDGIEVSFDGTPEGNRAFTGGFPSSEIVMNLAKDLHRACDPEVQGELGWPVRKPTERGNFAVLAKNGAALIFEDALYITHPQPDLNTVSLGTNAKTDMPRSVRIRVLPRAELGQSLTVDIISPNPDHLFPEVEDVVFPVKVTAHYGQSLTGTVRFEGSPYVWKTPAVSAEAHVELSAAHPSQTVQLRVQPAKPGHYTGDVMVTAGTNVLCKTRMGFVFRPEAIPPVVPPDGFDAFWNETLERLDKIPLEMTLEEQRDKETEKGRVYKVRYRAWGNRWAWAWLYEPKREGKFPAKIVCPPVSVFQPGQAQPGKDELSIYVAVHGGDIADREPKVEFDYFRDGVASRHTNMLRYSYSCLVRCFDIISKHEKCNGAVHVEGSSQGAGLGMVLAGLRPVSSVKAVAAALVRLDWTILGYTQWGQPCPVGADPKLVAEEVRYLDPACFAPRIHAPLKMAMGLFDWCAPAEGIFSAINALPAGTPCKVFIDPFAGHHSIDYTRIKQSGGEVFTEVPPWQGTKADNKVDR